MSKLHACTRIINICKLNKLLPSSHRWVCVRIAMAGWLHGVFVGDWLFVFPLCGFSLSLFCNLVAIATYTRRTRARLIRYKQPGTTCAHHS